MKRSEAMPAELKRLYQVRFRTLERVASRLNLYLEELLKDIPRIDRISSRAKLQDSFLVKASKTNPETGKSKYAEPLRDIQDQIGTRIIVFYKSDVDDVSIRLKTYLTSREVTVKMPDSDSEFGYFGQHFIFFIPSDVYSNATERNNTPGVFELQIKTLFQHAWSEASHDLGYKEFEQPMSGRDRRQLALTAAQSWGADEMFDQLWRNLKKS